MKKIFIITLTIMICSIQLIYGFSTYDEYLKSGDTSKTWDKYVKKAYKMIEKWRFEDAGNLFLEAIEKGCNSEQIYRDTINSYIKGGNSRSVGGVIKTWNESMKKMAYGVLLDYYMSEEDYNGAEMVIVYTDAPEWMYKSLIKINLDRYDETNSDSKADRLQYIERAAEYCKKLDDPSDEYVSIGTRCFYKGDYEEAGMYYTMGKPTEEGIREIADAFAEVNEDALAAEYYQKLDEHDKELTKLGNKYFNAEYYDEAMYFYSKCSDPEKGLSKIIEQCMSKEDYVNAIKFYIRAGQEKEGRDKIVDLLCTKLDYKQALQFYGEDGNNTAFYNYLVSRKYSNFAVIFLLDQISADKDNSDVIEKCISDMIRNAPSNKDLIHDLCNFLDHKNVSDSLVTKIIARGEGILKKMKVEEIKELPLSWQVETYYTGREDSWGRKVYMDRKVMAERLNYKTYLRFPTIAKYVK